ncbi:MAG: hypothetical protein K8S15_00380 [Candidatus Aegiribacteria sp.]|nr:hypothetical protein [Candidatus Aegiribacteria sp.]
MGSHTISRGSGGGLGSSQRSRCFRIRLKTSKELLNPLDICGVYFRHGVAIAFPVPACVSNQRMDMGVSNRESTLRLIGSIWQDVHEKWITGRRYLNMEVLQVWEEEQEMNEAETISMEC